LFLECWNIVLLLSRLCIALPKFQLFDSFFSAKFVKNFFEVSNSNNHFNWSGHSDPAKLKEKAEYTEKLSPDEILSKQTEIKVHEYAIFFPFVLS
jgi:hypothetical protein